MAMKETQHAEQLVHEAIRALILAKGAVRAAFPNGLIYDRLDGPLTELRELRAILEDAPWHGTGCGCKDGTPATKCPRAVG